ncbi:hypothetical protein B0H13DRAFT_1988993 [Mycena leptocephala]|nr:hypothetical protein B0H13DRAFT_1988993 [Mycena leptocephala]
MSTSVALSGCVAQWLACLPGWAGVSPSYANYEHQYCCSQRLSPSNIGRQPSRVLRTTSRRSEEGTEKVNTSITCRGRELRLSCERRLRKIGDVWS